MAARRSARTFAAAVTLALGVPFYALVLPRWDFTEAWFPVQHCSDFDGITEHCSPSWRPLVFFGLAALGAALWCVARATAYSRLQRRLDARFQQARSEHRLADSIADEIARLERAERTTTAVALAAVAMVAPFALHSLVVPGFGLDVFDSWMTVLGGVGGIAQLVLVAFVVHDTKRWRGLSLRALETDTSWKKAFWLVLSTVVATAACIDAQSTSIGPLFVMHLCGAAIVTVLTFALTWPLAHRIMRLWLVFERSELDSIRLRLEKVAAPLRPSDLG